MRSLAAPLAAVTAALLLPWPAAANGDGTPVDILAPDGFTLRGTYWGADGRAPGVLMLHQCNRDRSSWDLAASSLADAGFHVLALDFRGFGESLGEGVGSFQDHAEELWPKWDGDVDRALDFLKSMPGVEGDRLGAIGASCGGSQVLLAALRFDDVKAIALLSSSLPWLSREDITSFHQNRSIPVLAIASEDDGKTTERSRDVFTASTNPASRLLLYKGDAHGVPLFDVDPSLPQTIARFFADNL